MGMLIAKTSTDAAAERSVSVIYVTPDCTDSAVQKRAHGFLNAGVDLLSFSFRRTRYNVDLVPDWPNIELGITTERRLVSRLMALCGALRTIHRHRRTWRGADILYARNLDLALLALTARALTRCPARFVYEVLDVHPATTKPGIRGTLLRWLERRVLARCQLLVVSSPAFLRNYFVPTQGFHGESFLLENKWPGDLMSPLARKIPRPTTGPESKWTIGWFGNIRCPESLEILTRLADALPDRVQIYIRGCASLLGKQKLLEVVEQRDNMMFEGEYVAPEDLPAIYSQIHFNWCVDLVDGQNSHWLLPNRLYEGGFFGVPALAIDGHETGRVVRQRQWGISLQAPVAENLAEFLTQMTAQDYRQLRERIESLAVTDFVDQGDLVRLVQTISRGEQAGDGGVRPARPLGHAGIRNNG